MDEEFKSDPEVEQAWRKEVQRRITEIEAGSSKMYSWAEVEAETRAILARGQTNSEQAAKIDYSDSWSESDLNEFTAYSLRKFEEESSW